MKATADVDKILDNAIALAEERSWEAVRLHDLAAITGISLADIRLYFRDKEDLVDAWFDRADAAMLRDALGPDFLQLPTRQRLHRSIMAWLDALVLHRQVTRQMILNKCEPGHLHIQIPAIIRISRTVQWMRENAQRDTTYLARALEETVLTSIYLTTFIYWMQDDSSGSMGTRTLLDRLLRIAEIAATWLPWPLDVDGGAAQPLPNSPGKEKNYKENLK